MTESYKKKRKGCRCEWDREKELKAVKVQNCIVARHAHEWEREKDTSKRVGSSREKNNIAVVWGWLADYCWCIGRRKKSKSCSFHNNTEVHFHFFPCTFLPSHSLSSLACAACTYHEARCVISGNKLCSLIHFSYRHLPRSLGASVNEIIQVILYLNILLRHTHTHIAYCKLIEMK